MEFSKKRILSAPFAAMLSVTNRCNLVCGYCCNNSNIDYKDDMNREELLDVLEQLAEMKIFIVHFTGGEMFTREDIFDIFDTVKPWQKFTIRTNGTCITHNQIDRLGAYANFGGVGVSIDGSCEAINSSTRGKGNFEKSISTVKYMIQKGLWINIMFTVTKYNQTDIANMTALAEELGCKLTLNKLDPIGRAAQDQYFTREELDELCEKIYKIDQAHPNVLQAGLFIERYHYTQKIGANISICNKNHDRALSLCDVGFSFVYINADGNVYPCSTMTEPVLGNVREERLKFIWQNSRALKEIRSFKNMKMSDIQCEKETCRYSSNCFPGCRAISQRLTGSHYKTDPFWCLNTQRLPGAHQDA